MKISKIKNILIIGGDKITLSILPLIKKNFDYLILSSKRNLSTIVDGKTLEKHFKEKEIKFKKINNLDNSVDFNHKFNSNASIYLCMSSPWIIKKKSITKIKSLILNSHSTRLPEYRGGASFSWMVMNRVRFGFNNLYIIDEKIDTGKIIFYEEFLYPLNLNSPKAYFDYYVNKQVDFLEHVFLKLKNGIKNIFPVNQTEYMSSYFPRLNSDLHGWADWSLDFEDLSCFINSFGAPHNGCCTYYNNKKVYLSKVSPNYEDAKFNSYKSGLIYRKGPSWVCVAGTNGSLIIEEVFHRNKNIIQELKIGDRLYTPSKKIDKKFKRVFYDSKGLVKN